MKKLFPISLLVLAAFYCCIPADVAADEDTVAKAPTVTKRIFRGDPNGVSIGARLPDFSLITQDSSRVGFDDFYGKVWLVNIGYTSCGQRCDFQSEVMGIVQNALRSTPFGDDIHHATISANPDIDTPEALSRYIKAQNLDTSNWLFLTGARSQVSSLLEGGLNMSVAPEGVITQNEDFILIDWEGRVRGRYDVTKPDEFRAMKTDIVKVVSERTDYPRNLRSEFNDPRKAQQARAAKTLEIFNDFKFENRINESGISFHHKILDDLGRTAIAVHYDHGNAVAIADVDSDGLMDIYFTTLAGTNELWRNIGNGRFENITERAGLTVNNRVGMGASFADIDNDGDPDLYITNVRAGNILFENDGKGNFKDITEASGTQLRAHSSSATFFDYDRDGLLDLFVTNVGSYTTEKFYKTSQYGHAGQYISEYKYWVGFKDAFGGHLKPTRAETSILYRNLGENQFEDVSFKMGLIEKGWNGEATVIDANNDNWPDLYIANMQGNDAYFENQGGKAFERKDRAVFNKTPWGAMGTKAFDYDNDGDLDLYVTDMHSDMRKDIPLSDIAVGSEKLKAVNDAPEAFLRSEGKSLFGNAFYRNNGDGSYSEISDKIGAETYWPWGPSTGDLNADGYEDVFIAAGMGYPFRYSINSVLLNNQGGGFVDSEFMLGVEPRAGGAVATPWFEIDCAGATKGHVACPKSGHQGRHTVWAAQSSRSSAIFDLDGDGDQDIVTLEFNQRPMVLINNLSERKTVNSLTLELKGTTSNADGIGAVVKVYSGESIYTKAHDGKSGYLAQSSSPLYFGLGDAGQADKVEILWPSGKRQTLEASMLTNRVLEITEP